MPPPCANRLIFSATLAIKDLPAAIWRFSPLTRFNCWPVVTCVDIWVDSAMPAGLASSIKGSLNAFALPVPPPAVLEVFDDVALVPDPPVLPVELVLLVLPVPLALPELLMAPTA